MKKHLLLALATCITPLLADESAVGFQGSLPEDSKWQNTGSIPVESVDEAGVRCLSFADESEAEVFAVSYPLESETADRMAAEGFTAVLRFKHSLDSGSGGNFGLIIRLPGLSPIQITPHGYAAKETLAIGAYDFATQGNRNTAMKVADEFVDLRLVYRPDAASGGGNCEISLPEQEPIVITLPPLESSQRAAIELGGRIAERTGRTFVESLKLSIP